jgi:chromodomain-helicase-DNA-binding protein 7
MAAHEMFAPDGGAPRFDVLLTTYEFAVKEVGLLRGVKWRCIVVDEDTRLKNHESKLFGSLMSLDVEFKLLMTGTPLQNNIGELWALLHYMDPVEFKNLTDFQQNFGQLNESEQVINLQSLLKPLMLRRMKSDVEQGLSPLQEVIIECQMTQHQRSYCQSIYQKNMEYLTRGEHKTAVINLNNIFMELRKVCNHPYLVNGAETQILIKRKAMLGVENEPPNFDEESLIRFSGKRIV